MPHIDIESRAVFTNNPPSGAMRGFGVCQAAFALERSLDRLARLAGLDGWEFRWRNALDVGDRLGTGQKLDNPEQRQDFTAAAARLDASIKAGETALSTGSARDGVATALAEVMAALDAITAAPI